MTDVENNKKCPCGSLKDYADCCQPYIMRVSKPETAEALMRSRYTAYAVHDIDYIVETCLDNRKDKIDEKETRAWSENSTWLGLDIISVEKGTETDTEGLVEFKAFYERGGLEDEYYEKAEFKKKDGVWLYDRGSVVPKTVRRSSPKVGRNEACPCGSGRKYKHCHGKNV